MENHSLWTIYLYMTIVYSATYIPTHTTALLENLALLKGQNMTHRCKLQSSSWYFYRVGTNIEKIIYDDEKGLNGEYFKRAQVDSSSLVISSLTILSVQLDDAGIYGCKTLHNSSILNERAQVIVIESNLQICQTAESVLTCKVKYKGNFGPVIEWINDGSTDQFTISSTLMSDFDANGTRHLALMTDFVNSTLTCQLSFKDLPTHFPSMAINIPTYTDRLNSTDYCYLSRGTTVQGPQKPNDSAPTSTYDDEHRMTKDTTNLIIYSITIGSGVIVIISIIYISRRIYSVQKKSSEDDFQQMDVYSSAQMGEPQTSQRIGYEEMQERESPSEGTYVRLNPAATTDRRLPYVNVTVEETSSATRESRNDRTQQYLNVVIENVECTASDRISANRQNYENVSLRRERDNQDNEFDVG